ncbi:MAG: FkbM family methyltransferase [Nitrospira sp.]|nr:FkbM family methyltransferase [Nitrospira sp.]
MTSLSLTRPVASSEIEVVRFEYKDTVIRFAIDNPKDVIQSCHLKGCFYENGELIDLSLVIPTNARIIDVGANVGNHTVFFSKFAGAARVVVVEPNPRAILLLRRNIELNNLGRIVDTSLLGIGLGKANGYARYIEDQRWADGNLGAATLKAVATSEVDSSSIEIKSLDEILSGETPDLIKIDVEGMEMDVIEGACKLISQHRPVLYVEVSPRFREAFRNRMNDWGYRIERSHQRHKNVINYLCVPW